MDADDWESWWSGASLPAFWADGGLFGGGASLLAARIDVDANVRAAKGALMGSWRSMVVLERIAGMLF